MNISDFKGLLESPINSALKLVGNELQQLAKNRLLEYQAIEFKRNYYTKTLLHRSEPIKLSDFYLPLHIYTKERLHNHHVNIKKKSTNNISEIFSKSNYITLIGSAGSGKSTIVKYLFINSVEKSFKIPIKIELRYLNEYKHSFTEYIYNEIFLFHKLGFTASIIERLLNNDSFVFFLDGYDEISTNKKEQITKEIDSFVSRFPKNYFLITSRPYTNIDTLPLFTNYYVCDLDEKEIPPFIKKQIYNNEIELAEKIIKAVAKIDGSSYKSFLSNPLLLSMFILTFQSYSEIPQKRSDFYKQVFDTLFSVHDSVSKLSYVREKISGLSKQGFEDVLRLFSFISFFEERFIFQSDYLDKKLQTIKEKKTNIDFDNDKIINDLQVAIGVLNKEGLDYAFPHRSLQEYFAANYISNLNESNKKNIYKKIQSIINRNWFYVLENSHFLTLLCEQDYIPMLSNLIIPMLDELGGRLDDIEQLNNDDKYDIISKTFLVSVELLNKEVKEELIHKEFLKSDRPSIIILGNSVDKILFPKAEDIDEIDIKQVNRSARFIKERYKKWIESLNNQVQEQEKSDAAIIDII
ncbi:NACHT domain-containing NTPase [Persicobacter sp. CCB-QB2]|uniref:NACHT domain-containing protein n=1 Tax=Persicobacter sp. CCB-QB2 TaxID=1561025 RepID=UPI0006A982E8|nr:NACHT domain-containing protein [Persicobacter sp. CCB-QB2]